MENTDDYPRTADVSIDFARMTERQQLRFLMSGGDAGVNDPKKKITLPKRTSSRTSSCASSRIDTFSRRIYSFSFSFLASVEFQTYPHSKEFVQDLQDPTFTDLNRLATDKTQTRHRQLEIQFIQGRSRNL